MQVWPIASVVLNVVLLVAVLTLVMAWPGVHFAPPWDGPAVATVALTAAAVVVGAVGVFVGLIAVWGYTTLREHAANIAQEEAIKAANRAADRKVEELLRSWGLADVGDSGEAIAQAYERE